MRLRVTNPSAGCGAGFLAVMLTCAVLLVASAAAARADDVLSEVRLGVLEHDPGFAGGRERGVDFNGELTFVSPFPADFGSSWPQWLQWVAHPRPHVGFEANTAGATSQVYAGATWTAVLARGMFSNSDSLEFSYLFGPGYNDGYLRTSLSDRKSVGSNLLFHLGAEMTYWVTPIVGIGLYFDHSSNAGFESPNDSLNDVGVRLAYRF
jgi:lipid A 3-O-deacylase